MKFARKQSDASKPFRFGIWCDYGFTLTRLGGIGVFVYNLVEGLFALDEPIEVVMLVRQGDQHVTDCLQASAEGRLQVVPAPPVPLDPVAIWMDRVTLRGILLLDWLTGIREGLRNGFKALFLTLAKRAIHGKIFLIPLLLVGTPIAFVLMWAVYALFQLAASVGLTLRLPFKIVWDEIRKSFREPLIPPSFPPDIAKSANCDVWLIPYIIPYPLPSPSVLLIHDLVTHHYPEGLDPGMVRRVSRLAPARAAEATLVGCMSPFIRDNDLLGMLALSPTKVRMVPFAAPRDFPDVSEERAALLKPAFLTRPYVFFPSGIRGYKNQRILVEALRELRDRHNEKGFDLVFTGEIVIEGPKDLHELIDRLGLRQQVHVLGPVDRGTLGALFRCAFAVIVPSLYEQGSFPIYEALHFGCPVACSDIPSLREQCAPMGGAMLYFDPRDAEAVARTILTIRDHYEEVKTRQQEARHLMWQRTWKDVAREWLAVFKEAVELGARPVALPPPAQSPWPHKEIQLSPVASNLEILLFLQTAYKGDVWEATRPLIQELVKINKQRRRLNLNLAIHTDQTGVGRLEVGPEDLRIEDIQLDCMTRLELKEQLGIVPDWPFDGGHRFAYLRGAMPTALRADAWFALGDRFPAPLLPVRPYGMIIFDVLPTRFPEMFSPEFRQMVAEGMKPTAQAARFIIVTTTQARDDVQAMYGIERSRIRLIPRACEPHRRFQNLMADPVDLPRSPLVLNVTNASPHKGGEVLLRAIAQLKQRTGTSPANLVMCGYGTEKFSPGYSGADEHPHASAIRDLVVQLGLVEGMDVVFLGYVSDEQLRFLHEQCSVLVNAARFDDGSFSMIEGAYFGQRVISSRYPAAEYLSQRFGVLAKFFSPGDVPALANLLEQSLAEKRMEGAELEQVRATLASEEFRYRRFAERLYDCLVELAEQGRRLRSGQASIRLAA